MKNIHRTAACFIISMMFLFFCAATFCFADTKTVEGKVVGTGPNKVWMNIGSDNGVAEDMIFEVWRGDDRIAKVKVKKAGKTSSEAEVTALKEGLSCMTGDTVKSMEEVKTEPKKEEPKKEETKKEETKPAETTSTPPSATPTVTASTPTPTTTPAETKKEEPKKEEPKKEEPKKEEPKKTETKKEETKPKAKKRSLWNRLKIKDALYVVLILGGTMVIQK